MSSKIVYLTFDDGPHPEVTPWVMDQLDQAGAKGTFFVVGENVTKHPEVIEQLKTDGHQVANHTQHHVKGWRMSTSKYLEEVEQCAKILGNKRLFRPPFGQVNFGAIKSLKKEYEIIMWDVLTKDYWPRLNTSKAQKRIQKATRSGSIVVFHDSLKAENNLKKLLPEYLEFLKREGYQMQVL